MDTLKNKLNTGSYEKQPVVGDASEMATIRNYLHAHPDRPPHMVCCAELFKRGNIYVVFDGEEVSYLADAKDVKLDVVMLPVLFVSGSIWRSTFERGGRAKSKQRL